MKRTTKRMGEMGNRIAVNTSPGQLAAPSKKGAGMMIAMSKGKGKKKGLFKRGMM